MRMWMRGIGAAAVLAVLSAGCVDESDPPNGEAHSAPATHADSADAAPATTISASLKEYEITLSAASAHAGTVSFDIRNTGAESHAFEIEGAAQGEEWKTDPIAPGGTATLSVALQPGTYTVYCPIASGGEAHADRGMRTTFTVQ